MAKRKLTVIDGRLVLYLQAAAEGGYVVSSPNDPALNTQGETIEECIENARDAAKALFDSRRKLARTAAKKPAAKPKKAA